MVGSYNAYCILKMHLNNRAFLFSVRADYPSKGSCVYKDREYQFWKRNPLSIDLWTKEVFIQKIEYIHNNPVVAGLCIYPEDYKYSSAKFYTTDEDEFSIITHWMV